MVYANKYISSLVWVYPSCASFPGTAGGAMCSGGWRGASMLDWAECPQERGWWTGSVSEDLAGRRNLGLAVTSKCKLPPPRTRRNNSSTMDFQKQTGEGLKSCWLDIKKKILTSADWIWSIWGLFFHRVLGLWGSGQLLLFRCLWNPDCSRGKNILTNIAFSVSLLYKCLDNERSISVGFDHSSLWHCIL